VEYNISDMDNHSVLRGYTLIEMVELPVEYNT
jgi:hypothetical protein